MVGFVLILLSRGITQRKRVVWYLAFILLSMSIALHLMKGLDFEEASIAVLVIIFMLIELPRFRARSNVPTVANAFIILLSILVLDLLYGVLGFYFLSRNLHVSLSPLTCLVASLTVMFTSHPVFLVPIPHRIHWFLNSLWMIWEGGLIVFTFMLLRPFIYQRTTWIPDHQRAEELAKIYGKSSLVYFTLLNDKIYFFNHTQTAYIAYCQVGEVAVGLGDPVGPKEEIASTIQEFLVYCSDNSWSPAFYQVLPDYLVYYRQAGLRSLHIGDEAIVDLHNFSLEGKKFKVLRNTMHRFAREGYRTVWYDTPLDSRLINDLARISNDWLSYQGGDEKAYSLGWFDPAMIKDTPVVTVEDANGEIFAFANCVPMYQLPQASPDLMRYSRQAPPGIMDYLFLESLLHFQEQGVAGYNLGLAPLAHVGQEESATVTEKAISLLYENFYNFKGLYNFKEKFAPRWEPRFLIYPNLISLPRVSLAIVRADNPSGLNKFWRLAVVKIKSSLV